MIYTAAVSAYIMLGLLGSSTVYIVEGIEVNTIYALLLVVWTTANFAAGWALVVLGFFFGDCALERRLWARLGLPPDRLRGIFAFNFASALTLACIYSIYMAVYWWVYVKFPAATVAAGSDGAIRYHALLITTGIGIGTACSFMLAAAASGTLDFFRNPPKVAPPAKRKSAPRATLYYGWA
jgi:hypothetical protein